MNQNYDYFFEYMENDLERLGTQYGSHPFNKKYTLYTDDIVFTFYTLKRNIVVDLLDYYAGNIVVSIEIKDLENWSMSKVGGVTVSPTDLHKITILDYCWYKYESVIEGWREMNHDLA